MKELTYLSKLKYIPCKKTPVLMHNVEWGLVTILWSNGIEPLKFWSRNVGPGRIKRVMSGSTQGLVIEITSQAFCKTFIELPDDPRQKIGTSMPVLNLVVEFLNRPFCFEFQVRDDRNMKRRYRMSTCQKHAKRSPLFCHMPMKLDLGWNIIHVDLLKLTALNYGRCYAEFLGLQIYANCRIRRVFFSDRVYEVFEMPEEFRLKNPGERFLPKRLGQEVL